MALLASCGENTDSSSSTAESNDGGQSAADVWFEDAAEVSGVEFLHGFGPVRFWMPEVAASGLGLFDMDGDGDLDLYALQGCDLSPSDTASRVDASNRLFENLGDGTFRDVTLQARVGDQGFGMGCSVGDYDADGDVDLYVTNLGANVLYANRGDGTFEDVTEAAGVAGDSWSTSASFVDYDKDGHLDLFVVNYIIWDSKEEFDCNTRRGTRTYCAPNRYQGPERDRLYRNRGDGTFEDVSDAVGLDAKFGNGLGVVWGHLDDQPGLDFYVANDGTANQLWSATDDGRFVDRAMTLGCALSGNGIAEAGMGVCMEDMDSDGRWDMMVTHLGGETNTFYMGSGRGYRDRTARSGTMGASLSSTGFGVGMADFDHDGFLDMYVANGRVTHESAPVDPEEPLAEYDQVYRGSTTGKFSELAVAETAAAPALTVSRGAAFGDIDNDGDVDVCVSDYRGRLRVLKNVAPKRGAATTLVIVERSGMAAIGAVARFELGGQQRMRQVQRTYSYCATNDPRLHVGLGDATGLEQVEVTWLDGEKEIFGPVPAGDFATLKRGEGEPSTGSR